MAQQTERRLADLLYYAIVLLLIYLLFQIVRPFLVPLGWAAVLAIVLASWNRKLVGRLGNGWAAGVSTAGVTVILIVPMLLLATVFVREGIDVTRSLQLSITTGEFGWFGRAWTWVETRVATPAGVNLADLMRDSAARFGQYLAGSLAQVIRNVAFFVFELFVTLFALFFMFRDGDKILAKFRRMLPFEEDVRETLLTSARNMIFAGVTASLTIAAIQGLICGGAFAIVGLGSPIFWGMVMGLLSLLPVVGAWPVWIVAAVWLFSTGHMGRALVLVAICGGIAGTMDNILRPILQGSRSSVNGLIVFIGVLGGIAAFGVLGIVLGPIIVASCLTLLDIYLGDRGATPLRPAAS